MSIEAKIDELIAALDRNTAAQTGADEGVATEPAKRGRKPKNATESTQASTSTGAAASAPATAPAGMPASTAPPANPNPPPDASMLKAATDAIIKLAGDFSRDEAVKILAAHKVTRCSELPSGEWQAVLTEANAAIAAATAAKTAGSLV